jgi:hypothetical protein
VAPTGNNGLPLHIKDVGELSWGALHELITLVMPEEIERFRQHSRWFTDASFLEQKAADLAKSDAKPRRVTPARLSDTDIHILLGKKRIRELYTWEVAYIKAWVTIFCVLEEEKARRRLIGEPHLNDLPDSPEGAHLFPNWEKVSLAVHTEGAFISDFPWWFGQFYMPVEAQYFYSFMHKEAEGSTRYFTLTSVATGSRWIPYVASAVSTAIARLSLRRAEHAMHLLTPSTYNPTRATIDVCIDNIRIAGEMVLMRETAAKYAEVCAELGVTTSDPPSEVGESYIFLGVHYDHRAHNIGLAPKTTVKLHRLLQKLPASNKTPMPLRTVLQIFGYLIYTARVMAHPVGPHFHLYKWLRRRVSSAVSLDSEVTWWKVALDQARLWINETIATPRWSPYLGWGLFHLVLYTDASLSGWGAVLFEGAHITSRCGLFSFPEHINILEARALRYGIGMIEKAEEPDRKDVSIFVDNEVLRHCMINGRSRSYTLNMLVEETSREIRGKNINANFKRVASAQNVADILTRL